MTENEFEEVKENITYMLYRLERDGKLSLFNRDSDSDVTFTYYSDTLITVTGTLNGTAYSDTFVSIYDTADFLRKMILN